MSQVGDKEMQGISSFDKLDQLRFQPSKKKYFKHKTLWQSKRIITTRASLLKENWTALVRIRYGGNMFYEAITKKEEQHNQPITPGIRK